MTNNLKPDNKKSLTTECNKGEKTLNGLLHCVRHLNSNISKIEDDVNNKLADRALKINYTKTSKLKNRKMNKNKNKTKNRNINDDDYDDNIDCQPHQLCWIDKSGYDPLKDVHNIYYGFNDSCQTALHPLEGCNPSSPVYFTPPPVGF